MNPRVLFISSAIAIGLIAAALTFHQQRMPTSSSPVSKSKTQQATSTDNFAEDDAFACATNAAANAPAVTLAVGERFLLEDPTDSDQRASNLLLALCDAGKFETAVELADEAAADLRESWLKVIFSRWVQNNAHDAMAALDIVSDRSARTIAFQSAADSWAANNPSSLADYAVNLPDGDDKAYALDRLVDNWSLQDPAAFAAWLNTAPSGLDLDHAVATMLSKADTANYPPATAMKWVESMDDVTLKWNSFQRVITQWNQADPTAAQQYISTASWLDDDQRQQAQKILQPASQGIASGDAD